MADAASSSTADAVNHLVDKIGDGLGQITAAISSHAPQAWELVVRGSYARAVSNVIFGAGLLLPAIAVGVVAVTLWRTGARYKPTSNYDDYATPFFIGGIFAGLAAALISCFALAWMLDPHSIATIISPDGVTARDLLIRAL